MIPVLDKIQMDGYTLYFLENGKLFTGFELDLIDLESSDCNAIFDIYHQVVSSLPSHIVCRFFQSFRLYNGIPESSRKSQGLQYTKKSLNITFETTLKRSAFGLPKKDFSSVILRSFLNELPLKLLKSTRLVLNSLDLDYSDLEEHLKPVWEHRGACLDQTSHLTGVIKLTKLSSYEMNIDHLYRTLDNLPHPFTFCVSLRRLPDSTSESLLRVKSNRAGSGSDRIAARKYMHLQKNLEEVALQGERLVEFETVVLFRAPNEELLRSILKEASETLNTFGDTYIETFGAYRVFKSILPGGEFHTPILEKASNLPFYAPIAGYSTPTKIQSKCRNSLPLHRLDHTLHYFDVFSPLFDSYSINIIGKPGTGKSVVTNMLTRSIASNPRNKIFILDVGGSHSKNTESLGGIEYQITTDEPSGMNPFEFVDLKSINSDQIRILSEFIETLVREENESYLSKDLRSQIELSIKGYLESSPMAPSLDDFYKKSSNLPRRTLLSRWVKDGVFENCFKKAIDKKSFDRSSIHYFNFTKIDQAIDEDFSQGGLAGVLATFNLLIQNKETDQRYTFIADEVPIFIKRAFPFFALSIANIRKKGDAFVTIAQRSEHLAPNGDTSILDNSPTKFIFSVDGSRDSFKSRLNLSDFDLDRIEGLNRSPGNYADCFQIDSTGSRVFRIALSHEEYWLYTSKKEDQLKLETLMKSIPGLSMTEAIRCLNQSL